jgi:hypothetical protein
MPDGYRGVWNETACVAPDSATRAAPVVGSACPLRDGKTGVWTGTRCIPYEDYMDALEAQPKK